MHLLLGTFDENSWGTTGWLLISRFEVRTPALSCNDTKNCHKTVSLFIDSAYRIIYICKLSVMCHKKPKRLCVFCGTRRGMSCNGYRLLCGNENTLKFETRAICVFVLVCACSWASMMMRIIISFAVRVYCNEMRNLLAGFVSGALRTGGFFLPAWDRGASIDASWSGDEY